MVIVLRSCQAIDHDSSHSSCARPLSDPLDPRRVTTRTEKSARGRLERSQQRDDHEVDYAGEKNEAATVAMLAAPPAPDGEEADSGAQKPDTSRCEQPKRRAMRGRLLPRGYRTTMRAEV